MNKKLIFIILTIFVICSILCVACSPKIHTSEFEVVIFVDKVDENVSLLNYIENLQKEGKIEFEINNGMITSINGIKNADDYSSCWMIYCDDEENSNEAWGVYKYKDKDYASSMFGVTDLIVKANHTYIFAYITF